jgi:hypothetical protein
MRTISLFFPQIHMLTKIFEFDGGGHMLVTRVE